jgi:DNA-binding transcriptional ArsR family regulator
MDHETLFTASKWDILKHLEGNPRSPLDLSKLCGTSIANVSQQLRLLEMAGLVTSERVSNRDKGKPRVLYRIAGHQSYLIATAGDFVDKKLLPLSEVNRIIMRIWFHDRAHLQYTMEKAFWKVEEHLLAISYLGVDIARESPLTFYVRFSSKPVDLKPFTVTDRAGVTRQVVFSQHIPAGAQPYTLHGSFEAPASRNHGKENRKTHSGDGNATK